MTIYIEHINGLIREVTARHERLVLFGQNISTGSQLSGLTRALTTGPGGLVLNTPNIENTLVALGFGMMLRGVSSVFFMKQQDFLLLGLDHLVNTWNLVRRTHGAASFTIVATVVDCGYEGPQSCLNNLSDFCSMAQVPGYFMTSRHDSEAILRRHLVAPGFRILGVSQRLFRTEALAFEAPVAIDSDVGAFRYAEGADATLVAFNGALPQAAALREAIATGGGSASLFGSPSAWRADWSAAVADAARSGRLVVLDDSKSAHRPSDRFLHEALAARPDLRIRALRREFEPSWLKPCQDALTIDPAAVAAELGFA